MMYLGMGDNQNRGAAGGQDGRYGRILRFDAATGMPPATGNVAGWTFDYGLRNPYRLSFDLMTADLYIGDVGDGTWEELNFAPAGKTRQRLGLDHQRRRPRLQPRDRAGGAAAHARAPAASGRSSAATSTGARRCPACAAATSTAPTRARCISLKIEGGKATDVRTHGNLQLGGLGSFGLDANGEIYMSSFTSGTVRKLVPAP